MIYAIQKPTVFVFKAWDFTSSIHNAARWPDVDRHLLCSLTGALAEAMYGCEYRLLKEKYGSNWYNSIVYPDAINEGILRIKDYQYENRNFFPKNSALTNVWEYRYGIYLDDGWVYVYRSAVLLARFRYVLEDRFYTIKDVQKSDQSQEVPDIAIGEALKGEPEYR